MLQDMPITIGRYPIVMGICASRSSVLLIFWMIRGLGEGIWELGIRNYYNHVLISKNLFFQRDMLEVVLSKLSTEKNVLFRSLSDDYELCLTKCRTSSHSVLHENSYKDPINKHCFGDELPRSRTPD